MKTSKDIWIVEGPGDQRAFESYMAGYGLKARFLTAEPVIVNDLIGNIYASSLTELNEPFLEKLEAVAKESNGNGLWVIGKNTVGPTPTAIGKMRVICLPFHCTRIGSD
ncbi:MAG: hypothetical protein ABSF47_02875 [Minisyncoccia bacterium]|jgi:hypothetical protein